MLIRSKLIVIVSFIILKSLSAIDTDPNEVSLNGGLLESKQTIRGKVLRLVIVHYPPMMIIGKKLDGTHIFRGVIFDVLNYIEKALDISYEYVFVKEKDAKTYGLGPAQTKLILDGEADLVASGIIVSHSKYQQFDFSTAMLIEPFRLLVPWPKEESRLLAPIRPFELPVWLCLIASLSVLATTLTFIIGIYQKYMENPILIGKQCATLMIDFDLFIKVNMFLWSHLTKNRYYLSLTSRASYLAVGIWCLMTVVLANGYAGTLLSFLTVPKLEPIINSIRQLAYSKNVQLVIQARSEVAFYFLNSTYGTDKLIGDSLRAHPENMFYDPRQVVKKLMAGKYALAQLNLINFGLIDATYRENQNKCKMTLAKEPIFVFTPAVQVLAKHGPYTKVISEQIQVLVDTGILNFYIKRYKPNVDKCLMENQKMSAEQKSISLLDISSAFLVLGLGMSLSIFIFILELIFYNVVENIKKQESKSIK